MLPHPSDLCQAWLSNLKALSQADQGRYGGVSFGTKLLNISYQVCDASSSDYGLGSLGGTFCAGSIHCVTAYVTG